MDSTKYYDAPSPSSSDSELYETAPRHPLVSNSGNKLEYPARFIRKGKVHAWGPAYEDSKLEEHARTRLKRTLEAVFPDAASEIGTVPPPNIVNAESSREAKRVKKEQDSVFRLPHLRSPSPPASTAKLATGLAIPQTYLEVMMNNAMRHTLANDTSDRALASTSSELLDSEKGLTQALGRLREVLRLRERDVVFGKGKLPEIKSVFHPADDIIPSLKTLWMEKTTLTRDGFIPPLPRIAETDNLWRVTQELIQSTYPNPRIVYSVTDPTMVPPRTAASTSTPLQTETDTEPPKPIITPIHRLFTHPDGLTLSAEQIPPDSPEYPHDFRDVKMTRYHLDMPAQTRAVDDALERIMELLVDCNEYKERLEETRDRVADVARVRKRVWAAVKERTGRELEQSGQ